MEIYKPGSDVTIGGNIDAKIISAHISGEECRLVYNVVWWSGNTRTEAVLEEFEIQPKKVTKKKIGFR